MKRREFVGGSAALSLVVALSACRERKSSPTPVSANGQNGSAGTSQDVANPLAPPTHGSIPVAFLVSDGTVMIDLAGPWEVFSDVMIPSRGTSMDDQMPFRVYTVAQTKNPVRVSGGLKIQPEYTFASAPSPKVLVIPAQQDPTREMLDWIRKATQTTDVTMSVCTGAFLLASTGLLSGKSATTHHDSYRSFALKFPDISVKPGARFVEVGNLATSGGLSSGIDLALRVVERYFGRKVAADTACEMEYQGKGWMDPSSNAAYLRAAVSSDEHPLCPVCSMEVNPASAPKSVYKGKTYYFCSNGHKARFDAAPDKWL